MSVTTRRGGCFICWPRDGSWPCATSMAADELRDALAHYERNKG